MQSIFSTESQSSITVCCYVETTQQTLKYQSDYANIHICKDGNMAFKYLYIKNNLKPPWKS